MFLTSAVKRGRLFTYTAHVQILAKNMAAKKQLKIGMFIVYVTLCFNH
jgi:hypothetical protein